MTRSLASIQQELEDRVMQLYGEWSDREAYRTPARPFAFFVWLGLHHSYLTAVGAWGSRGTYQHISELVTRWESLHGEIERTS